MRKKDHGKKPEGSGAPQDSPLSACGRNGECPDAKLRPRDAVIYMYP